MSVRILTGHVIDVLATLEDASVQCVVTSPPYYGLRSYSTEPQIWGGDDPECEHEWQETSSKGQTGGDGSRSGLNCKRDGEGRFATDSHAHGSDKLFASASSAFCLRCQCWRGELGQEPRLDRYLSHLIAVFDAVKRVLRPDGTLWVNISDSYASKPVGSFNGGSKLLAGRDLDGHVRSGRMDKTAAGSSLKPKNLLLVPHRFAIAMQEAGWVVRSDIIWAKKSTMPESVTDRCTVAHEHVFMFAKHPRYYADMESVREEMAPDSAGRYAYAFGGKKNEALHNGDKPTACVGSREATNGRNLRSVWHLGPEPLRAQHYASFPTEIPRRCIKMGSSERGCCPECRAPWKRVVERYRAVDGVRRDNLKAMRAGNTHTSDSQGFGNWRITSEAQTLGWQPTCTCPPADPIPCTILDCFAGAGTTGLVADRLGRDAILIDLNGDYVRMSLDRIRNDAPLFADVSVVP